MPLDLTKPVQTRDGRKVRILCTDANGTYPLVALIDVPAKEFICRFFADGRFGHNSDTNPLDLINTPTRIKRTVWLNVYRVYTFNYASEELARSSVSSGCLACAVKIEIDVEEGHGL